MTRLKLAARPRHLRTLLRDTSRKNVAGHDDEGDVYDLCVVGAGPVGVQSALSAATTFQKRVILVDAPRASGMHMNEATGEDLSLGSPTGLFSKALRDSSKTIRVSSLRGVGLGETSIWNEIVGNCVDLSTQNAQDTRRSLVSAGVSFVRGFGTFQASTKNSRRSDNASENIVEMTAKQDGGQGRHITISARNILIATGSKPFRPSNIPFDGVRLFDSDSINTLSFLPKSIAITGSGIIAIEYAKIFRNLGSDVTLIIRANSPCDALTKIGLDKDVAAALVSDLVQSGIKIQRGAQVKQFLVPEAAGDGTEHIGRLRQPIRLLLEARDGGSLPTGREDEISCDAYLAAVGRLSNSEKLGLDTAGIDVDKYGGIHVDNRLQTTCPNVYAAGDVVGHPFLASTGVAQGNAAVVAMFATKSSKIPRQLKCNPDNPRRCVCGTCQSGASFDPSSLVSNPSAFPTGIWSSPEAAFYGWNVQQAIDGGLDAGESKALYSECLRGRVFSPYGLLKLVFEKPAGRILGVHICGDDACELIHYGMELVKARRTIKDLTASLYSAITYHEMYRIAAQAALDRAGTRKRREAQPTQVWRQRPRVCSQESSTHPLTTSGILP
uniref:NAD(P)(+) transhydrogenase (Si-specific) n=1 Tax=Grammatophora oceanica TaxID=210454 RepID=A0A7S1UT27_9STRA|mmetsp:Transcript_1867/g.2491  ORF Transcript_1867/g.2491 Transcript_1867/m.2491 type:complete len:610 (+) Transcript_1867:171-2000(+)